MSAMSSQMKDLMMLVETKSHSSPRVLLEGKLNESYIRLAEDIHSDLVKFNKLLVEFQLSQDQIDDIFKKVSKGAKDGYNTDSGQADPKSNRTMLGRGADAVVVSAGAGIWNKLKDAISRSAPVEAFDADYNQFIDRYKNTKGGKGVAFIADLWRKLGDKYPKTQGFLIVVMSVLTTLGLTAATGPLGILGAPAVTGVIRFVDRLLMGDRLSSAAWKAIKMAGLQFLLTQGLEIYGEDIVNKIKEIFVPDVHPGPTPTPGPTPAPTPTPDIVPGGTITVPQGTDLSNLAKQTGTSVQQWLAVNPQITNADYVIGGETLKVPTGAGQIYQGGVGTAADTAAKVASGAYKPYGVRESIDYKRIKRNWALQESLNLPQISAVYLTNEGVSRIFRKVIEHAESNINEGFLDSFRERLTNKITYDSLANRWKRNRGDNPTEGSVDSKQVAEFLRSMGVKDSLINKVYGELEIPTDPVVDPNTLPPEPTPVTTPDPKNRDASTPDPDKKGMDAGLGFSVDYTDRLKTSDKSSEWGASMEVPAPKPWDGKKSQDNTQPSPQPTPSPTPAPTPEPVNKAIKYQDAMRSLKVIMSKKDKDRIIAWIENNWKSGGSTRPVKKKNKKAAPSPQPIPGPIKRKDRATPAPKPAPKPADAKNMNDNSDWDNWKASDTYVESARRRKAQRQLTQESRVRPPWLGKR